jgi:hypothetical protein
VQNDPSKRAANRVCKKIAAALAGNPSEKVRPKPSSSRESSSDAHGELIRVLSRRLAEDGPEAASLRAAIVETIAADPSSTTARK